MKWFIFLLAFDVLQSLQIVPLRSTVVYENTTFIRNTKTSVRRRGRRSEYVLNYSVDILQYIGDNATVIMNVYEILSGNYVPMPLLIQFKLCDFLFDDRLIGKLLYKQLPANVTCPIKPGFYPLYDLSFNMDLPFYVPFTHHGLETMACVECKILYEMKDLIVHSKMHFRLIQKPRKMQS